MKRTLVLSILTVGALSAAAEWGTTVVSADGETAPLDLSPVWNIAKKADVRPLAYSAAGWDCDPVESGRTVTLVRIFGEADETEIVSGLEGRGTYTWTLSGVQRKPYRVEHRVLSGGEEVASVRLTAVFDFTGCTDLVTSDEDMIKAVKTDSLEFGVVNDKTNPWVPIGGPGEGIAAPTDLGTGVSSAFTFIVKGKGVFSYDYAAAGAFALIVDGQPVENLAEVGEWTSRTWTADGAGAHTVTFVLTGPGAGNLKSVSWICPEPYVETGASLAFRADLREGVRTAKFRYEVLPFAYSSTNFIGLVGTDASSVARVTVTPLVGENEDVTAWTPVTEKTEVLVNAPGEGLRSWRPRKGVYLAKFEILTANESVHEETAIFDLREYGAGLILLLK